MIQQLKVYKIQNFWKLKFKHVRYLSKFNLNSVLVVVQRNDQQYSKFILVQIQVSQNKYFSMNHIFYSHGNLEVNQEGMFFRFRTEAESIHICHSYRVVHIWFLSSFLKHSTTNQSNAKFNLIESFNWFTKLQLLLNTTTTFFLAITIDNITPCFWIIQIDHCFCKIEYSTINTNLLTTYNIAPGVD